MITKLKIMKKYKKVNYKYNIRPNLIVKCMNLAYMKSSKIVLNKSKHSTS